MKNLRRLKTILCILLVVFVLMPLQNVFVPIVKASPDWSDDFESYTEDSNLHGQGIWTADVPGTDYATADTYQGSKQGHLHQNGDASWCWLWATLSTKEDFPCNVTFKWTQPDTGKTVGLAYVSTYEDSTNNFYVTLRIYADKLQWYTGAAYQDVMAVSDATQYEITFEAINANTCTLWVDGVEKVSNIVRSDRSSTSIGVLEGAIRKNEVNDMYLDDCSIQPPNTTPTNDARAKTDPFTIDQYGWVNITVTDTDGVADLKTVDIKIDTAGDAETFTLRWTQSTNIFSEVSDSSGICTLDTETSTRVNIDSDTDKICFYFKFTSGATTGLCDITATSTDDQDAQDVDTWDDDFTLNEAPTNSVTLNSPITGTQTSLTVNFNFTATFYQAIQNASIYTNETGSWQLEETNSSAVNNATSTIISHSLITSGEGDILWNVGVWNSTTELFASSNATFTWDIPPRYRNVGPSNGTSVAEDGELTLYGEGYDGIGLDWAWLATNETATWQNYTDSKANMPLEIWNNQSYTNGLANPSTGWTKYSGNPIIAQNQSWCDFTTEQASIVQYNTTHWFMFFEGANTSYPVHYKVGCAYSTNLQDWTMWSNNPVFKPREGTAYWDNSGVGAPSILKINSTHWYMWYHGRKAGETSNYFQIGLAYTTDSSFPEGWTRYQSDPVLSGTSGWFDAYITAVPDVIHLDNGTFWMYYEGWTSGWATCDIGLATSNNGVDWTKYGNNNPVINHTDDAWTETLVSNPDVWFNGSRFEVYVSGGEPHGSEGIGMYYSSNGVDFTGDANNPLLTGDAGEWDAARTQGPCVYKHTKSDRYYLFYNAIESATNDHKIGWSYQGNDVWHAGYYDSPMDMNDATDWAWGNFTWQNTTITSGTAIQWRIYYNDTYGNVNVTSIHTFNVGGQSYTVDLTHSINVDYSHDEVWSAKEQISFNPNVDYSKTVDWSSGVVIDWTPDITYTKEVSSSFTISLTKLIDIGYSKELTWSSTLAVDYSPNVEYSKAIDWSSGLSLIFNPNVELQKTIDWSTLLVFDWQPNVDYTEQTDWQATVDLSQPVNIDFSKDIEWNAKISFDYDSSVTYSKNIDWSTSLTIDFNPCINYLLDTEWTTTLPLNWNPNVDYEKAEEWQSTLAIDFQPDVNYSIDKTWQTTVTTNFQPSFIWTLDVEHFAGQLYEVVLNFLANIGWQTDIEWNSKISIDYSPDVQLQKDIDWTTGLTLTFNPNIDYAITITTPTAPTPSVPGSSGELPPPWQPPVEIPIPTKPALPPMPPKPIAIPLQVSVPLAAIGLAVALGIYAKQTRDKRRQPSLQRAAKTWTNVRKAIRKVKWKRKKKPLDEV